MSRTDPRNACLAAMAVVLAFLAVNPFVELPFDDDFSYAFTVHRLLQTGHIIYNGWSTATLITHVYWGALFAKCFGFSFTVLRFSTLPFAAGSAVLCYLLARLAGLFPTWALFTALLLGLSPLFLPLATSFMTDIPGLFFILLSIYSLARAALAPKWFWWLTLGTLSAICGGMGRQVVWVVALAILPCAIFFRRQNRRFVSAAVIAWILVVANACFTINWFNQQPNVVIDQPFWTSILTAPSHLPVLLDSALRLALTTFMILLPATSALAVAHLIQSWNRSPRLVFFELIFLTLAFTALLWLHPSYFSWPWITDILSPTGVLTEYELSCAPPAMQPRPLTTLFAIAINLCAILSLIAIFLPIGKTRSRLARLIKSTDPHHVVLSMMLIFALSYIAMLIPRMIHAQIYDRYVLPLIPVALIPVMLLLQRSSAIARMGRAAPFLAWTVLAIYTCFSLALTQDVLALARARVAAVRTLESVGIPPTAIAAGLEYDAWTQLQFQGQMNISRIANATIGYNPRRGWVPALLCEYRIEYSLTPETAPSLFPPIHFFSFLPPFHHTIYIDRFKNPRWLESTNPARTSVPHGPNLDFEKM